MSLRDKVHDQIAQADAGLDDIRIEPIDAQILLVAKDQPFVGTEQGQAVRHVRDRTLDAVGLDLQRGFELGAPCDVVADGDPAPVRQQLDVEHHDEALVFQGVSGLVDEPGPGYLVLTPLLLADGSHVIVRDSVASGNVSDGIRAQSAAGKAPTPTQIIRIGTSATFGTALKAISSGRLVMSYTCQPTATDCISSATTMKKRASS